MIITKLEEFHKNKLKVYLDEEYAFPVSISDEKNIGLEEGMEISEETLAKLLLVIVFPNAKQKAISLLKFMDRTEKELKYRLSLELYPEDIIEKAIAYAKEYGFINDERYAESYIRSRREKKSKMVIKNELLMKGINKEIIDNIFLSEYQSEEEDPEMIAIRKAIDKKVGDVSSLTREEKQKLIAYLYRKGFQMDKIRASNSCLF